MQIVNVKNFCRGGGIVSALLLSALLVAGCVPEPSKSKFLDQDVDSLQDTTNPQDGTGENLGDGDGAGNMDGTWLSGFLNSSCILGQEQVGISYQLVNIAQNGNELTETREICGYDLSEVLSVKPIIPPKAREAAVITISDKGFVSMPSKNAGYVSPSVVITYGLKLADPKNDPMPPKSNPLDPTVSDDDNDGNPGVTFKIKDRCDRYTAQRQVTKFLGTFETPNLIKGSAVDRTDAVVFGGSDTFCEVAAVPTPNDRFSKFAMARVDGLGGSVNIDKNKDGKITCEEAKPYFDKIMPVREPVPANCK